MILVLYFTSLQYTDRQAIALYAYTTCLAYLSPIAGALLADGPLGRYTTILSFGGIYVLGLVILTLGASWSNPSLSLQRTLTFLGLFLICLGTGGIKPCVSAFGADQVALRPTVPRSSGSLSDSETAREPRGEGHLSHPITESTRDSPQVLLPEVTSSRDEQVRAFFSFFYVAINVGALTSNILVPEVRSHGGFGTAFALSTLVMIAALFLFWWKRHDYVQHPKPQGSELLSTFRLCWWLGRLNLSTIPLFARYRTFLQPGAMPIVTAVPTTAGGHLMVPSTDDESEVEEQQQFHGGDSSLEGQDSMSTRDASHQQKLDDAAQALHVMPILLMLPVFWCLYDQQSSVWTLQATRMELHGWQPEQLNVVNPLQIMVFVPLFDRVLYPALEARGADLRPLRRMAWGMVMAAVSFFVSGLVESAIQKGEATPGSAKVSVGWQLPQITILAVAEILLSVTGLEFSYANSPEHLKAFVMAVYLLTTALGNLLGGVLYSSVFANLNMVSVLVSCGSLMLLNLAVFVRVARWWEHHHFRHLLLPCAAMDDSGLELVGDEESYSLNNLS